jgi:hypothetical protein
VVYFDEQEEGAGMNGYAFLFIKPDVVEIHEDVAVYRMSRAALEAALANVRANERSYEPRLFGEMIAMYENALTFLDEEMKK